MKENTKEYYQVCLTRAIHYIETNLHTSLQLETIASIAFISPYHFHRLFKAIIGDTIHNYITRIRLEKAAMLLKNSNLLISEIAIQCGYNQLESFSRAFSRYFNYSPSEFREKQELSNQQKNAFFVGSNFINKKSPTIIHLDPILVAYIRHTGPYNTVSNTWKKLITWKYKNWDWKKSKMYGIIHDSPEITEETYIRYDACIQIKKSFAPTGEINYKLIEGGKYAMFEYKGPYEGLNNLYDYIYSVWIFEENKKLANRSAFEEYLNSPQRTKPENLKTKIFIPLDYKK